MARDWCNYGPGTLEDYAAQLYASLDELSAEDEQIVGRCIMVAALVASQQGLDGGYRLVANTGDDGGQEVAHLHFHVLGGRQMAWPPG